MSNKETKAKFANAVRAMKAIGLSEDKVKPVLNDLLKLFDQNWACIEEENYRVLADTVFDRAEAELPKKKNVDSENKDYMDEEAQAAEEKLDQPKRRLRRKYQDGQGPHLNAPDISVPTMPLTTPKEAQEAGHSKKIVDNEEAEEEIEQPLRRLRRKCRDSQGSSSNAPESSVPKMHIITPQEAQADDLSKKTVKNEYKDYLDEEDQTAREELYEPLRLLRKYKDGQRSSFYAPESSVPKMTLITPKEEPKKTVKNEYKDYLDEEDQTAREELYEPLRLLRKYKDGQRSSFYAPESSVPKMTLITPKEEPNELPETRFPNPSDHKRKGILPISHDSLISSEKCVPNQSSGSPSPRTSPGDAGKEFVSPQTAPFVEKSPIHETETNFELHNGSSGTGTATEHKCSVNEKDITDGTAPNEPRIKTELSVVTGHGSNLEIASFLFGEVKISLSCDLVLRRPDFRNPSCEAVVRLLEEKCLKSYKILDPRFSVMNLVKDMCQGFMELGSDSHSEPAAAINMTRDFNLLNKLSATGSCVGGSNLKVMDCGDELPEKKLEKEKYCAEDMNPSLMVCEQQQLNVTPETIKSVQDVFDIANGQENVVITLVNEVNDERPPPFYYLPRSAVYQNAHVNFTLARIGKKSCCPTCSKDCLTALEPCACAHESGGAFAYTCGGLVKEDFLKECISINRNPKEHSQFFCKVCPRERAKGTDDIEPCKGHTMRKFIKECWWKCGCGLQCGNRVVQRGMSCNLQVFMTGEGKGWGLRTMVDLPKGAFVCEYVGAILTNSELYNRVSRCPEREKHSYPVVLDANWGGVLEDEKALCLDAAYYGNVGRFINHRCYDSNLVDIPVEVESPDRHYYHLAFFTTRKVNAMEELTWDYGIDFDDHDQPFKVFRCQCGSKFCRNMKRQSKTSWGLDQEKRSCGRCFCSSYRWCS